VGCEGLELHILHWPHMDSIDLDLQPLLGVGYDNYKILNRFRIDLGSLLSRYPIRNHLDTLSESIFERPIDCV
jgi:hypothetical protein